MLYPDQFNFTMFETTIFFDKFSLFFHKLQFEENQLNFSLLTRVHNFAQPPPGIPPPSGVVGHPGTRNNRLKSNK